MEDGGWERGLSSLCHGSLKRDMSVADVERVKRDRRKEGRETVLPHSSSQLFFFAFFFCTLNCGPFLGLSENRPTKEMLRQNLTERKSNIHMIIVSNFSFLGNVSTG